MELKAKHHKLIEQQAFDYLRQENEWFGFGKDDHRFLTDDEWHQLENGDLEKGTDYLSRTKPSRLGGIVITDDTHQMRPFKARSDGDAVYHAVFDAIAMALKIGNIGDFFPNTDQTHTNLNSQYYLHFIKQMLEKASYEIVELGVIITKKKPYLDLEQIKANLAENLAMDENFITVFATTGEDLGMAGSGRGVHVDAFCRIRCIGS